MSNCGQGTGKGQARCARTAETERTECVEERDEGYNQCSASREERQRQCCDWAPCSWFCDAFWWLVSVVCVAWEWISNIVCVAWATIKQVVCTLWLYISAAICHIVDFATAIVSFVVAVAEAIVNAVVSAAGFIWGLLTSIPGLGRILSMIADVIQTIVNLLLSVPDIVLTLLGIMPEKKLRLGVIVLKSADGQFVVSDELLHRAVQCAINVFRDEVNVRVIPIRYAQYQTPWAAGARASRDYLFYDDAPSSDRLLDVCCGGCAWGQDLGTVGADFNAKMIRHTFWGNGRRLLGYGSPIVAFTVRTFQGGKHGCSLGPLSDWVTVLFENSNPNVPPEQLTSEKTLSWVGTLTHEMAHACNLWHVTDDSNIMHTPPPRKYGMSRWQKSLVRASRHVTYA